MKPMTRKLIITGLAGTFLFSAAAVIAGGPDCNGFGPHSSMGGHGMMGHGHSDPRHATFNPQERAGRHLSELKAALKLQPAQESAWDSFAAAATEQAKAIDKARDEMHGNTLTTPERIDLARKFSKEREQGMDKVTQAMKTLYETLTPEQRKVLDQQHGGRNTRSHRMHG